MQAGQICRSWEASEQVLKVPTVALPVIGAAAPLLQALASGPLGSLVPAGWPSPPVPAVPAFAASAGPGRQQCAASSSASSSSSSGTSTLSGAPAGRPAGSSWGTGAAPPARSPTISPSAAGSGTDSPRSTNSPSGTSSSTSGGAGIEGLAGVWIKDQAASDSVSYGRACDLMQLNGLQKQTAMQLIEGLEIEQQGQQGVAVRYLTGGCMGGG